MERVLLGGKAPFSKTVAQAFRVAAAGPLGAAATLRSVLRSPTKISVAAPHPAD